MTRPAPCPDALHLRGLIDSSLPDNEQAQLIQHVDSCTSCQLSLEELAGGTTSSDVLRGLDQDRPPAGGNYYQAVRALQNEITVQVDTPPDPAEGAVTLDFLAPAEQPGSLGRLGHFEVVQVIGRGGMGVVLKGLDECLERHVALKVLDPQLAHNDTAHKRFCREARAAASITHEHVVAVHEVDEDEKSGLPYLVMQLVEGESLQDRLDRDGPLPLKDILRIGMQTAAGLSAAHAHGLIHRDIKPANILLEDGKNVRLTDFGLARAYDDVRLTQSGFLAGTPLYMSPEQALGQELDPRTDLFSLGGVLYALCTGHAPFGGSSPFLVLKSVTESEPRPIGEVNADIPDWLSAIIGKLLAKKREDRYQSAAEVAELLGRHLAFLEHASLSEVAPCLAKARAARRKRLLRSPLFWTAAVAAPVFVLAALALPRTSGLLGRPDQAAAPAKAEEPPGRAPRATFPGNSGPVWSVAFSPGGKTLAMAIDDDTVKVWDTASGKVVTTLHGHKGPVWSVAYSPDGATVATASSDRTVRFWKTSNWSEGRTLEHKGSVRSLAFSRDGGKLVSGTRDGTVTVWTLAHPKEPLTIPGHLGEVVAVAFSPDQATVASASGDKTIKLWDAHTGREEMTLQGHQGGIYAVAFAPDGKTLASGGWDHTVRLWDVATGANRVTLTGHEQDVWSVAFSPDGRTLASASEDRTVKLWDVAGGRELETLRGHTGSVYAVAFAPDGKTLASAGRDGTVRLWDVLPDAAAAR
ncbi:MAG TPA: serine/threonine-protein kinase [Gemmataceae bacterium]|nr:serine/threonine-protein kinase [Gemmataceae bacterium]